jgi:hypothetical protein
LQVLPIDPAIARTHRLFGVTHVVMSAWTTSAPLNAGEAIVDYTGAEVVAVRRVVDRRGVGVGVQSPEGMTPEAGVVATMSKR